MRTNRTKEVQYIKISTWAQTARGPRKSTPLPARIAAISRFLRAKCSSYSQVIYSTVQRFSGRCGKILQRKIALKIELFILSINKIQGD